MANPLPSSGHDGTALVYDEKGRERCRFYVEHAVTPSEQSRGLMFRTKLDQDRGMLFVFDRDAIRYFWMQNTFIPLDIIFINSSFMVVHVHRRAKPLDQTVIESRLPARYVLEVNGGKAEQCGVNPGTPMGFTNLPK